MCGEGVRDLCVHVDVEVRSQIRHHPFLLTTYFLRQGISLNLWLLHRATLACQQTSGICRPLPSIAVVTAAGTPPHLASYLCSMDGILSPQTSVVGTLLTEQSLQLPPAPEKDFSQEEF